jgi:peptidoglycan/xylan/chitin deacetylase (PgdA/CDA1 family)
MKLSFILFFLFSTTAAQALECSYKSQSELGAEIVEHLNKNPISCYGNPVHLTFDDGPSATVTPAILHELALRKVKATFFVTTTNLASKANQDTVKKAMSEGHLIASHGHKHDAYCLRMDGEGKVLEKGFTQAEREEQIQTSVSLLNKATNGKFSKQTPMLFRLPYGRGAMPSGRELNQMVRDGEIVLQGETYAEMLAEYRQISPPLQTLAGNGFSHLGWNVDSGDSSFPVKAPEKEKIKEYILKNLVQMCGMPRMTKVALFHDIKEMNIQAIPVLMDVGKCLGLSFVSAQDMAKDKMLAKTSILIDKETIKIDTVKQILTGLDNVKKVGVQCEDKKDKSTCVSENGRTYKHCQGDDSVCFEGKWYAKTDPVITLNCK